jgi:hypothetical protein
LKEEPLTKVTAATAELERLDRFVGVWSTEGEIKAGPSEQLAIFRAIDIYEWLPGGQFLLHRFDADMPDGKVQGIEVIGYSHETNSYPMYSFDNSGNVSLMQACVESETWTFVGQAARFTGGFLDNGKVFAGVWERRSGDDDAPWQYWMDVRLTKVE